MFRQSLLPERIPNHQPLSYGPSAAILRVLDHPYFVVWCFGLFILLRALILLVPVEMGSDALWYLNRAAGIAAGEGYSQGGYPTAWWPVGYPGFLGSLFWFFGTSQTVGQIANLVCAAASFFLVLALTRHIFQCSRSARLAVALLAIYPNNIAYTSLLLTETYFTFLMLLGCYLFIVRRTLPYLVVAGLVFGFMALTKPQAILVPGFLALLWLVTSEGWQRRWVVVARTGLVYVMMACVLVPWAVRNTTVFGELVLISTNGNSILLEGNNPSANGKPIEDDPYFKKRNFSVEDQVATNRRARQLAIDWITSNPKRFLELIPLKIFYAWAPDGEAEWAYQDSEMYEENHYLFRGIRVLNQGYYLLLILSFAVAIFPLWRYRHKTAWPWSLFGYVYCGYLTLLAIVFFGHSRFHYPVMPWVIMTVAWAAVHLLETKASRGAAERLHT
jgi:hypothetical protein